MNVTPNYDRAAAYDGSGSDKLPAGGYICRILKAWVETTYNGSEQLALALDIAEGEYKDYYARQYKSRVANDANAKWGCNFKQFTLDRDGNTNPFFKGLLKAVEESNHGYSWNWQEATLANKLVGMVFREEEFEANDGSIKTTVRAAFARSVEKIRAGVEVPEIKRLNKSINRGFTELPPDEMDKLPWEV